MVGGSIVNIYNCGTIFTEAQSAKVNMSAEVIYRGYGPEYHTKYNLLYSKCATDKPFA